MRPPLVTSTHSDSGVRVRRKRTIALTAVAAYLIIRPWLDTGSSPMARWPHAWIPLGLAGLICAAFAWMIWRTRQTTWTLDERGITRESGDERTQMTWREVEEVGWPRGTLTLRGGGRDLRLDVAGLSSQDQTALMARLQEALGASFDLRQPPWNPGSKWKGPEETVHHWAGRRAVSAGAGLAIGLPAAFAVLPGILPSWKERAICGTIAVMALAVTIVIASVQRTAFQARWMEWRRRGERLDD